MTSARKAMLKGYSFHGLSLGSLDESFSGEYKSSRLSASRNARPPEKRNEYLYELAQTDGTNVGK